MTARFQPGDRVRVRRAFPPGHVRTPFYARGRTGEVVALAGTYGDPEALAYGRLNPPVRALYRVRFAQAELWGASEAPGDDLVTDIYEHWLEPADG